MEYQDGVKIMDAKRGSGFKKLTVVNSSKHCREEKENVDTEKLTEPVQSHYTV